MTRDEVIDVIDEMLKNPRRLTNAEFSWIKKIDKTVGNFSGLRFTKRQYCVIIDIYERFKKRNELSANRRQSKYDGKEAELLLIHFNFYRALETGKKIPETEAQKHFIEVCHGRAKPRTPHEKAYVKYMKSCKLKG